MTKSGENQVPRCALMLILAGLILPMMTSAAPPEVSSQDRQVFDQILEPVWKVYNLVKYLASAVAAIFLAFAGVTYMTSGNDMMKRENAKHMISYVVLGMIVIWAAPFIVELFSS